MDMNIGDIVLKHYEITDILFFGGQAVIAKGRDAQTGQVVIIKQLSASPDQVHYNQELARFKRAAQIRISHPNVVDPIDFGEDNNNWYTVFPFIEGMNMENHLSAQGGKLGFEQATSIIIKIATGLEAIHNKGYIHRDIKPLNIMICADGNVKIIDFGICRDLNDKTITQGDGLLGTLQYMSPEQVANPGSEDYRTDYYSLAAVFYWMLAGQTPVQGNDPASVALSICQHIPSSPRQFDPSIPPHVDQACMRMLAKKKEDRFQSIQEFLQALQDKNQLSHSHSCTSCKAQIQPRSNFCANCGAPQRTLPSQPEICIACGTSVGKSPNCPGCGRHFSHADHRLCFDSGSLRGIICRIPEGIYDVGRQQLCPRDCHISRCHFYVACSNGMVQIQDAKSSNKTYVAGKLADKPIQLSPAQQLCIAGNTATYNSN